MKKNKINNKKDNGGDKNNNTCILLKDSDVQLNNSIVICKQFACPLKILC